ncbi:MULTISPECIES: ankyrin repeat domain-containing protein [Aphanothece]|uniref:ankyrin repeat domain-containing protein n=1 Tax=Aphanothece TaxID=1121 RepID=UPI003984AD1E
MTELMHAVKADDLDAVRACLAQGADVNQADAAGDWPVIFAAYLGHTRILQVLLEAGADLTVLDPGMKATALHAAAYAGHAEACRLLIAHGISLNQQGPSNGYTALHDAVWQSNLEAAAVIVEAGADLTIRSRSHQTPLDLARSSRTAQADKLVALLESREIPGP